MGFNAVDKTASGRAIAELLNAVTIECDGYFDVVNVGYADSTDEIVLNCVSGDYVIIPRETSRVRIVTKTTTTNRCTWCKITWTLPTSSSSTAMIHLKSCDKSRKSSNASSVCG